MRIAMVTQWFDPEGGSAAIPGSVARALQARGHQVEVVTGFPNYPHGRLYDGYRIRGRMREVVRGVNVTRLPLYPSHDRSPVRRTVNFLSFMLSAATLGAWSVRRCDVALVYSTPATVGLAGVVLRRVLRRPFVLYIQDLWPDTVTATGMVPARFAGAVERVLDPFCRSVYAAAERIAVISPGMKDRLVERGFPADRIDIVYNWVDEDVFRPVEAAGSADRFEVMYAGNLGDVQGLEAALHAVASLPDLPDLHLRLVGDGVARPRLEALADSLGISDRVHFEGVRDVCEMARTLASADVQLVSLSDDPLFHITMPSKIQAILACGQPLITSAPGDASRLTVESGAGFATGAGDAAELAAALRTMLGLSPEQRADLGRRGRDFYEARLSAAVGAGALEQALREALERHEGGPRD
jgi:glycosyltransferase involved in cell wall biosynthesis